MHCQLARFVITTAAVYAAAVQFDGRVFGGAQVLDRHGYFLDPFLPLRNGAWKNVFPQDIIAAVTQDLLQLEMVRKAAALAATARGLASSRCSPERLGGPDMPGTRIR